LRQARRERLDLLIAARRQRLASRKLCIEIAFKACGGAAAIDHDQIIVLPFQARCGKVRGTGNFN
jgi:hypothetical protein